MVYFYNPRTLCRAQSSLNWALGSLVYTPIFQIINSTTNSQKGCVRNLKLEFLLFQCEHVRVWEYQSGYEMPRKRNPTKLIYINMSLCLVDSFFFFFFNRLLLPSMRVETITYYIFINWYFCVFKSCLLQLVLTLPIILHSILPNIFPIIFSIIHSTSYIPYYIHSESRYLT